MGKRMTWLQRLLYRHSTERMLDEFLVRFPGRCPICSYYEFGRREFYTTKQTPPHNCLEAAVATPAATESAG